MEKIIGIDVGLKRIGVAFSNGSVVVPLPAVIRKNRNQASRDVSNIINEYKADTLIVGLPLSNEEMQRRIKHFVSLLDYNGNIVYIDESYTSAEVEEEIKGVIKHKKDGRIDSLVAKKLIERVLNGLNY